MLFDRIARPRADFARASAGVPSFSLIAPLGSVTSASGQLISQSTAMSVSTVYACVRRVSQDVARCSPSLYRVEDDGTRINVDDHPLVKLFERPNRVQSWFEWIEQMKIALLLRGNAYAVALRDGRGRVRELIPVNPDAVMVLEAADGSLFYQTNRIGLFQMFVLGGMPLAIPEEDMFHIRGMSFNSLVGVSVIGLARDAIGVASGQEQQAARWMANGARPSGVLESDKPLSEDAARRLRDRWEMFKSGIQNVGATAVLEDGVKWKPMNLSSTDLEFLQARQFQVPEVCRFFGVPPHKVFLIDRAAAMSIPQQDQDYVNGTISPALERLEQKFEQFFGLIEEGINCHFDEGALLRADVMTRFNALRIGVLTGILTPNEARETEGLQALPGGDNLLVPANTAALGSDMTGTAADEAGRPTDGDPPPAKVGTGGTQPAGTKVNEGDDELPGAEELQPRALLPVPVQRTLLLSGVPVRHQPKIRARLIGKRIVPTVVIRSTAPPAALLAPSVTEPAIERAFSFAVNVDARQGGASVRRSAVMRRNDDGSMAVDLTDEGATHATE